MPRNKRDVESALVAKGFRQEEGDHRFFVYYTVTGLKTRARTKTSHGGKMKEIPDNLLTQMAKQCKVTRAQFLGLVDCPLDQNGYEAALHAQGEL